MGLAYRMHGPCLHTECMGLAYRMYAGRLTIIGQYYSDLAILASGMSKSLTIPLVLKR